MQYFIELLRTIAVAFILNSHCEGVYPIELAIGGEIGLAIFFLLTGYLSTNITEKTSFKKWFRKRALRIYMSLWILDIALILCGRLTVDGLSDILRIFIYPTNQWFASFIVIAYAVYFLLKKYVFAVDSVRSIYMAVGVLLILYFITYCFMDNSIPHHLTMAWHTRILWMACILTGMLIKESGIIEKAKLCGGGVYLLLALVLLVLYGVEKVLYKLGLLMQLQFLCFLFPIGSAVCLFIYMGSIEGKLKGIKDYPLLFRIFEWCSKASFEIYIVQFTMIMVFREIAFPLNLILIVVGSVLCGNIIKIITDAIVKITCKSS